VVAGDCSEIQYTESANRRCVFEVGVEGTRMRTYHRIDVFSRDSRVCEIPPRKHVVFQSRHSLWEIGNQFMQDFV